MTTTRHRPNSSVVSHVAADDRLLPEQRLAGALLADSIRACQSGDATACEWLRRCAELHIAALAGDDVLDWQERLEPLVRDVQLGMFPQFAESDRTASR